MPEQETDAKRHTQVIAEPKPKKTYPKRDRKAYMQQYYLKHKIPALCSGCNQEFACPRTLKYHEENNKTCMIRRLEVLFGAMHKSSPEEGGEDVEPGVKEEMRRKRKFIIRGEVSSKRNEG